MGICVSDFQCFPSLRSEMVCLFVTLGSDVSHSRLEFAYYFNTSFCHCGRAGRRRASARRGEAPLYDFCVTNYIFLLFFITRRKR